MSEKVVLAYSGGLDTSIIIPWLKENYGCEVIAMVGDVGQGDDLEAVTQKAYATGAAKVGVISEAAREQLKGSADMVQAMDHISDVASSNASSTESVRKVMGEQTAAVSQMASAAQELTNLSIELQTVVSRFRLG